MQVRLIITAGPHAGREFIFAGRDTFLVGRSMDAHFQVPPGDPYFSRRHFVIEVNPPRCRLLDLNSRNGVLVNGTRVRECELADGDEVAAGDTAFRVAVFTPDPDAVPTQELPPNRPPPTSNYRLTDLIPGYDLGPEIGRGGVGVVYRAARRADRSPAAVKVVTPVAGADRRQVERFLREARVLGALAHARVVRFLEAGEGDGVVYIAMELVDGPDAHRVVKARGPRPVEWSVRVVGQVQEGLAHAHAAGFVHRDVKPSNLLLARAVRGRAAKLADFGLARAFEASQLSGITLLGEVGGTPHFMPPEQVTHYRDVGPAADQYAAAATLYYLLTGRYAYDFPADTGAKLALLVSADPVPVRARRADIPVGLAVAIGKAMSRDPVDRFPSADDFRTALAPYR